MCILHFLKKHILKELIIFFYSNIQYMKSLKLFEMNKNNTYSVFSKKSI